MSVVTQRLYGESNKDFSYRTIREWILCHNYQSGEAINVLEISNRLKVSKTPLKEALSKLQRDQLVDVIPQVGTYVSEIKLELVEEYAFMRFYLEKEVLLTACISFPEELLFELKKNLILQEIMADQGDIGYKFLKLDNQFHYLIFKGIQREYSWRAVSQLAAHYERILMLPEEENWINELIIHHKNIISIIEKKEIGAVENIIGQHILKPIKKWICFNKK